ncbi:hypothetical protein ACKAV7_004825 [Fusarium commune]
MDPRRWSPTKSSWLESALNKPPESPKTHHKSSSSQPAWMAELNKNKGGVPGAEGATRPRPGSISHKHQVSIGGLMRSTPMGTATKTNTTGLARGKTLVPVPKPKPETPPKKDFRSSLRHRPTGSEAPKTQEPEFKNVFGTLRRTKTQNYVAPDELKDNILKGKASLSQTGGPKKTERVDEFKEAILKKKDDFKKAQVEGKGIFKEQPPPTDSPLPEGLARRAEMARRKSMAELKSPINTDEQALGLPEDVPTTLPEPEPSSPTKVDSDPVVSVKNARAMFGGAAQPPPLAAKPSWDRSEASGVQTPPRASPRPLPDPGRSSPLQINKTPSRAVTRPLPTPPTKEPQTPQAPQAPKPQQTASTAHQRPPARAVMPLKIQSLSFQVFQISAEGKKTPVSAHNERTLFEREMYIAPTASQMRLAGSVWRSISGSVTKFLSRLLTMPFFVQKEAKALGGKLVKMQQGKETTEFLQALGGVVD